MTRNKTPDLKELKRVFSVSADSMELYALPDSVITRLRREAEATAAIFSDRKIFAVELRSDEHLAERILARIRREAESTPVLEEFEKLIWQLTTVTVPCSAAVVMLLYFSVSIFDVFGFWGGALL